MQYYRVEPEVAGGWGANTQFTRTPGASTVVHRLHYQFEGWLGDELLTSTPCFIVTEALAREIEAAKLTGATFAEVEVTTSAEFEELHPALRLPRFVWLKIDGVPGEDDFGLTAGLDFVVSEQGLAVLDGRITQAVVEPLP